jgi:ribulose-phosphate 3-epimerase
MIENHEIYTNDVAEAGPNSISFHIEAVKPKTSIDLVHPFLDQVEMILVMTVEPGFGCQSFMKDMMIKVSEIRKTLSHNESLAQLKQQEQQVQFALCQGRRSSVLQVRKYIDCAWSNLQ